MVSHQWCVDTYLWWYESAARGSSLVWTLLCLRDTVYITTALQWPVETIEMADDALFPTIPPRMEVKVRENLTTPRDKYNVGMLNKMNEKNVNYLYTHRLYTAIAYWLAWQGPNCVSETQLYITTRTSIPEPRKDGE